MFRTVSQRLTLWYTVLFAFLSLGAFVIVYTQLTSGLVKQMDERLRAKAQEFSHTYELHGKAGLAPEFSLEARFSGTQRVFFRLMDRTGKVLASSDTVGWKGLEPFSIKGAPGQVYIQTLHLSGRRFPVRVLSVQLSDAAVMQIGMTLEENEKLLESYREAFSTAFFILLACGGLGAYLISKRAMSGVIQVTEAAARIGTGHLNQPLTTGSRGAEVENLAAAFNTMQGRIAGLIDELKAVINNVAHDLRMPITRIRGMAETTLTGDPSPKELQDLAVTVIEESDRLVALINTILELAEADAGMAPHGDEPVDIVEVAREAGELFRPAAEDRGVVLKTNVPDEPLFIRGDIRGMRRVAANLLDNAVKYTPSGGEVEIQVSASPEAVTLMVNDTGMGISPEAIPNVFNRFYRGDTSRSTPGSGLGLSLARAIVQAHGGEITVTSLPREGSRFTVVLPRTTGSS